MRVVGVRPNCIGRILLLQAGEGSVTGEEGDFPQRGRQTTVGRLFAALILPFGAGMADTAKLVFVPI